jgi:hypothetical protein
LVCDDAEAAVSRSSYNTFEWRERQRAYDWLKREWAAGRRAKVGPECNVCGQTKGYLMAHSEDYSAPYGPHIGRWSLCYWCHMLLHCRFRAGDVFHAYVAMLENGERFVNLPSAHWHRVQAYLAGRLAPSREPTDRTLVDPFGPLLAEGQAAIGRRTGQEPFTLK